ncbi:hypothetical protein DFH07DRAFT_826475, partial [Mycena maculata]
MTDYFSRAVFLNLALIHSELIRPIISIPEFTWQPAQRPPFQRRPSQKRMAGLPASVLHHIVDAHCHPTEAPFISDDSMNRLDITVCAMSTNQADQSLVRDLALRYPTKVIPCFGYHPWFTHFISLQPRSSKYEHYRDLFLGRGDTQPSPESASAFDELLPFLPEPITIEDVLLDLRHNFESFPSTTSMLGEVGVDKGFRVAFDYHASPRKLSPFTIPLDHQLSILEAQLDLAIELGHNVSLHSVKYPQGTVDLLNKVKNTHGPRFETIRINIHSCSMNPQVWTSLQKKHSNVFLSLSTNQTLTISTCARKGAL